LKLEQAYREFKPRQSAICIFFLQNLLLSVCLYRWRYLKPQPSYYSHLYQQKNTRNS